MFKLIRHKILQRMRAERGGIWPAHEFLRGTRLLMALLEKLREEVDEAAHVPLDGGLTPEVRSLLIEELADVREVIETICRQVHVTDEEVRSCMHEKRIRNGGFDAGVFLKEAA